MENLKLSKIFHKTLKTLTNDDWFTKLYVQEVLAHFMVTIYVLWAKTFCTVCTVYILGASEITAIYTVIAFICIGKVE